MGLSNAERQARWRAKRDAEIKRLRNGGSVSEPHKIDIHDVMEWWGSADTTEKLSVLEDGGLPEFPEHWFADEFEAWGIVRLPEGVTKAEFDEWVHSDKSHAVSNDALKKENADLKSGLQWANSEKDRLWRELGEVAAANTKLRSRKGVFTSQQFNFLRACLHPERNFSDDKLTQMRQFLESLENVLVKPRKS